MQRASCIPATIFLLALAACAPVTQQVPRNQPAAPYDVLITGGKVVDGSGNPWTYADLAIRDGRIAAVGRLASAGATAARTIDARGKIIAPGFIDIHSHADDALARYSGLRDADPRRRAAPNIVSQGVTTVVVNQDGRSPWPIRAQSDSIRRLGIGVNSILLVGHGTVRRMVMGDDARRPATADEIARMRELVRQAMREGARGLSAGLEYEPGRWSTTEELVALVEEIAQFGGVYISHQRSEGPDPLWYVPSRDSAPPPTLLDAIRETIEIGERTGATVVASHLKVKGATYRGTSSAAIALIEQARARGVQVWADQYSYNTSGTDGNTVLIPRWAIPADDTVRAGAAAGAGVASRAPADSVEPDYAAALRRTLADSAAVLHLRRDIAHEIARRGGPENIVVFEYPDSALVGRSLAQISARWQLAPVETAIRLQLDGNPNRPGGARMRGFSMAEEDIEAIAAQRWVASASDGGIALPEDGPATHARFYGNFPRRLRHYVIERRVVTIEDAIRSMTSLPAQIFGLRDRGLLREGTAADVVVFDPDRIRDMATFFDPHQHADGVEYVLVNGEFVVDGGRLTGALPGQLIR